MDADDCDDDSNQFNLREVDDEDEFDDEESEVDWIPPVRVVSEAENRMEPEDVNAFWALTGQAELNMFALMIKTAKIASDRTPLENLEKLRGAGFPIYLGPLAELCPAPGNPWFIDQLMKALRELPGKVTLTSATNHWNVQWEYEDD